MNDSQIVKKYIKLVYYLAHEQAQNPSDVDDIVQEVFLRYVDKQPAFPNDQAAKKWFSLVTKRIIINMYSTAACRKAADITPEEYENQPSDRDFIRETEDRALMHEQLEKISPQSRTILLLRFDCGYSIQEIADYIGENVAKTKVMLMRSKREYRKLVVGEKQERRSDVK